ncbi:MAG: hypothetical protein E7485_09075 [Ruminococcaceae bacterium]|nr:hypothetical protein [Oscillospiraceae bacterium]
MTILVNVKQLGKKRNKISEMPFFLENEPCTLRELITESVRTCVTAYNARLNKEAKPLSEDDISAMSELGKIAFGLSEGAAADLGKATEDAILAFEDGLYRIFLGEQELTELDGSIELNENSSVTFIRLVMLAGRMW